MKVELSPAEIGVIIHALEEVYQSDSSEIQYLAQSLYDKVFNHLSDFGLYADWCKEFDLLDEM